MASLNTLFVFCISLSGTITIFSDAITLKPCMFNSTCSCNNADGYIDLHPIANNNNTPHFSNVTDGYNHVYSFNPCYGFDEGSVCQNAAICQLDTTANKYNVIGYADTVRSVSSSMYGLMFKYSSTTDMPQTAYVVLVCDATKEGELQFVQEDPVNEFYFYLYSTHACAIPPAPTSPGAATRTFWTPPPPPVRTTAGPPTTPSPTSLPVIFSQKAEVVLMLCILIVLIILCGLVILSVCVFSARLKSTNNEKAELGQSANYGTKDETKIRLKTDF
ncbi:hypothetical protein SNE40_022870 [Patella caerulea]|uniref:MRH domain-containing protein n=1 Tax=Patella caerulea TaxID=87958 RepID=A0AAN8GG12_PATCE